MNKTFDGTETIGSRVKWLREKEAMSKVEFGQLFGVSDDVVAKWEKGQRIYSDTVVKICEHFKVSCDWLLLGGETENLIFMNKTGLSDSTIKTLLDNPEIAYHLNFLSEKRFLDIVTGIYLFLLFDPKTIYYKEQGEYRKYYDDDYAEQMQENIHLFDLMNELKNMREELQKHE